jgi:hypothetical protein
VAIRGTSVHYFSAEISKNHIFHETFHKNLGFYSRERCQNDAPDSQQRRSKSHFLSPGRPQVATLRIRKGPRSPQRRPGLAGWPAAPGADSLMTRNLPPPGPMPISAGVHS